MVRSGLIVDLVKAGVSGDQESARETAEAIAANERALTAPQRPTSASPTRQSGLRVRDGAGVFSDVTPNDR